jgi:hypothetical protein
MRLAAGSLMFALTAGCGLLLDVDPPAVGQEGGVGDGGPRDPGPPHRRIVAV